MRTGAQLEQEMDQLPPFPDLATLHARHPGVTQAVNGAYAEAAAVCLSRHHTPPLAITVESNDSERSYELDWPIPSAPRVQAAWANEDDATRDGAYGIVLAAAECHLGLVALGRARAGTGADYLVGPRQPPEALEDPELNLEGVVRLEVSGFNQPGSKADLRGRLRVKIEQTRRARSIVPAVAGVVGFSLCLVLFGGAE